MHDYTQDCGDKEIMADSNFNVTVTSHKKEVLSEFDRKLILALSQLGMLAEGYAKKDCPVDTGRLRNSITYATATTRSSGNDSAGAQATAEDTKLMSKPEEDAVYIGTNVVYAAKQEYGDSFHHTVGKAHFLRDAATTHGDEYKKEVEKIMKS